MKGGDKLEYKLQISMAAARVNAGLTQSELARRMKVSRNTVVNWETGKVIPNFAQLNLFCSIVKIPIDYIFLHGA